MVSRMECFYIKYDKFSISIFKYSLFQAMNQTIQKDFYYWNYETDLELILLIDNLILIVFINDGVIKKAV